VRYFEEETSATDRKEERNCAKISCQRSLCVLKIELPHAFCRRNGQRDSFYDLSVGARITGGQAKTGRKEKMVL
jgi:hypothetical protein